MSVEDRYFEPDVELMARSDLRALQEDRVVDLVRYAYERAPLYRRVWDAAGVSPKDVRSLDDFFERVPVITKDTVRAFRDAHDDPYGGLLCIDPSDLTAVMSSSGTTGDPTFFAERFERWSPLQVSYVRSLWECGLRPGDHTLPAPTTFRASGHQADRLLGAIPLSLDTWMGNWEGLLPLIRRYDVRYAQLMGPLVTEIDRLGERYDLREALAPLKAVSYSGQPLGSRMRAKIRQEWGVELFQWTSAGDCGTSWECREHNGFHLWEDEVVVEALDPVTRTSVPVGSVGELVVTDIDNVVAPLIRYAAEDLVRLDTAVCGCGRTHVRQWPLGRAGDLTVVQGVSVMPLDIWEIVEQFEETSAAVFQIVRADRQVDRLRLRIGYDEARTHDPTDLRDRLVHQVEQRFGILPELELVTEAAMIARSSSAAKIPRVAAS